MTTKEMTPAQKLANAKANFNAARAAGMTIEDAGDVALGRKKSVDPDKKAVAPVSLTDTRSTKHNPDKKKKLTKRELKGVADEQKSQLQSGYLDSGRTLYDGSEALVHEPLFTHDNMEGEIAAFTSLRNATVAKIAGFTVASNQALYQMLAKCYEAFDRYANPQTDAQAEELVKAAHSRQIILAEDNLNAWSAIINIAFGHLNDDNKKVSAGPFKGQIKWMVNNSAKKYRYVMAWLNKHTVPYASAALRIENYIYKSQKGMAAIIAEMTESPAVSHPIKEDEALHLAVAVADDSAVSFSNPWEDDMQLVEDGTCLLVACVKRDNALIPVSFDLTSGSRAKKMVLQRGYKLHEEGHTLTEESDDTAEIAE